MLEHIGPRDGVDVGIGTANRCLTAVHSEPSVHGVSKAHEETAQPEDGLGDSAGKSAWNVANQLWPDRDVTLTVLSGGLTNFNFKASLKQSDTSYVIRIFGRDAERVGVDREAEVQATKNAAELGIGPNLVASLPDLDALVTEFLPGAEVTPEQLRDEKMIVRVAEMLRILHGGPPLSSSLDPFEMIERYHGIATEHDIAPPADYAWANGLATRIRNVTDFALSAPCHGDLLPANLIDGKRLCLVDFEYAGMSDPRGDLADLSAFNGFSEAEDWLLIGSYFGDVDSRTFVTVRILRFISYLRAGMWSLAQEAISQLDIDFHAWAADQFAQLRELGTNEEFLDDLRELESSASGS
jgi:thiamine kinase-like enzyme